jgi:hypothetical protein
MSLEIQYRLKNDANYLNYLHQNSQWYKYLNRNPNYFKQFEEEAKENMSLRLSDKISSTLKTIELLENVVSSLK